MPELTEQEKQLLELMKQLEAADPVVEPRQARNQDFLPGFDDQGNPFPLTEPLPSAEQQAADNERLIQLLAAQLAARKREAADRAAREAKHDQRDQGDQRDQHDQHDQHDPDDDGAPPGTPKRR